MPRSTLIPQPEGYIWGQLLGVFSSRCSSLLLCSCLAIPCLRGRFHDVPDYKVGLGLLWASDEWGAGVRRLHNTFHSLSAREASYLASLPLPSKPLTCLLRVDGQRALAPAWPNRKPLLSWGPSTAAAALLEKSTAITEV